ncbi:MAG: helix-turn-helix transcriptional regulator [Clostridia bacterium]|nr:helix-turn-helix transcriptional regulator [Clostridia bacterium]
MIVTSDLLRGNTETVILSLLEKGDSYGYEINKGISRLSGGEYELKEATLYCAFRRMEEAGYISSYWGSEERGARRRYYRITETGREALAAQRRAWIAARDLLDRIILKGANENG